MEIVKKRQMWVCVCACVKQFGNLQRIRSLRAAEHRGVSGGEGTTRSVGAPAGPEHWKCCL